MFLDPGCCCVYISMWLICRPPQTKILRTDSSDCMYVMNCVEVEITSPEEAFEVLFKGKTLNLLIHPKIILGVWLWHTVKTPEHQHFLIYLIRKNKSMIYTVYTIFYFTYLKKNSLWVKYVWEYTCIIFFFFNTR